jgi:Lrp/AsnC family transcriptional regulator for asnA, asnC and gidA
MIKVPLDDVDERILGELQTDGRQAFREIARRVGVSEGTVRTRVRRLEAAGLLRILAFVDPASLGTVVLALILVRLDTAEHDRIVDATVAWPEVTYASSLVGRADLYLQVICEDNDALWNLLGRLRSLPGVRDTETMHEMAVHKFTYRNLRPGAPR